MPHVNSIRRLEALSAAFGVAVSAILAFLVAAFVLGCHGLLCYYVP